MSISNLLLFLEPAFSSITKSFILLTFKIIVRPCSSIKIKFPFFVNCIESLDFFVYYDRESQQTKKSSDSIQLTKKGNLIFMEEQGRTIILKVSNIKLFVIEEKAGSKNNKRFEILICV